MCCVEVKGFDKGKWMENINLCKSFKILQLGRNMYVYLLYVSS